MNDAVCTSADWKKKQTEYTPCTFSGSDFCCKFPLSAREHLRLS